MKNVVNWLLTLIVGPFLFLLGVYALVGGIVGLAGAGEVGDCKCGAPRLFWFGWTKFGLLAVGVVLVIAGYLAIAIGVRSQRETRLAGATS